jgi:signal transduction histidine kinase
MIFTQRFHIFTAMLKTIKTKFILVTIIFILLAVGIPTTFLINQFRENFDQRSKVMLESTLDVVNSYLRNAMLLGRQKNIPEILKNISKNKSVDHIRIIDKNGIIKYASNPLEIGKDITLINPNHLSRKVDQDQKDIKIENNRIYSVTSAIENEPICLQCHADEGDIMAYLDVDTDLTQAEVYFHTGSTHMIFLAIAIVIVMFFGFYFIFNRLINRPLDQLQKAMDKVESGNLDVRLPAEKEDEIGQLEGHFNHMVQNLQTSKQEIDELHFEQLKRADKLVTLGELAAEMAHEINNPAGIVMSRTDFIQMDSEKYPQLKKYNEDFDVILSQIKKISKITGNILKYSRKLPKEFQKANLEVISEETLNILGPRLAKKKITIEKQYLSELPEIIGDATQLEQVFTNLVNNAIDALDYIGKITIQIRNIDEDRILWSLEDNGVGMDQSIKDLIFSPFFTTKSAEKGTGLGLYIVRNICKNHNAEITCESTKGHGTTFKILFPVQEL